MACTEAGTTLVGPDLLDYTVNGRPLRRPGQPDSNRSHAPAHGTARHLPGRGRRQLGRHRVSRRRRLEAPRRGDRRAVGAPTRATTRWPSAWRCRTRSTSGSRRGRSTRDRFAVAEALRAAGVPAAAVARPEDRIDHDPGTAEWGLWPTAHHREMGDVRVDGMPVHLSETDWVDRAGRSVPRRAQPPRAVGDPRARRRRDRAAGEGRRDVSDATEAPGPLDGLRVVELASEHAAFAGKMLGDLGADVIVVEPPGGHPSRAYGPFVDDVEDPERSLWWWHYNTSKRGVVLDLDSDAGAEQFRRLAADADIVLEGEPPDALATLGPRPPRSARRPRGAHLGVGHAVRAHRHARARARHRPHAARRRRAGVELRVRRPLAAAGARRWQPGVPHRQHVRGDGRAHRGAGTRRHRARPARRREHARGGQRHDRERQLRVAGRPGVRCSARPAGTRSRRCRMPTQMCCADGRYVTTGFPPRAQRDFEALLDWLDDARAARRVPRHRAARPRRRTRRRHHRRDGHRPAGGRDLRRRPRGADVHRRAHHRRRVLPRRPDPRPRVRRGRGAGGGVRARSTSWRAASRSRSSTTTSAAPYRYPGAPFLMPASPWRIARRAPHVGEHDAEILGG